MLGQGLSGMSVYGIFMDDNYGDNSGAFVAVVYEASCVNGSWTHGALLGQATINGTNSGLTRIEGLGSIGASGKAIIIEASGTITWRAAFTLPDMTSCPALSSDPTGPISLPVVGPCAVVEPWMSCGRAWRLVLRIMP